ncbi:MAG: cation:proton antiporter [Candidatus Bipolaricaulota bacterium]|nr:cation:proton antiporter [Candidatus Bipolaricaulota bacterium]
MIELGAVVIGLAALTRLANRFAFSAIPLYLLAGLALGQGGLLPVPLSENLVHLGAEIGVLLLLFMLGLEYSGEQLRANLRSGLPAGLVDLALNFPPGLAAGLLLGWSPLAAVMLGGVTYISSSGVAAGVLTDLGRMSNPETPAVVSILVLEDLTMAMFLPLVGVLLVGQGVVEGAVAVLIALAAVGAVLFVAIRYGRALSRLVAHRSNEATMFGILGLVLLVAGLAERLQVSAAIGAFLVGIAISGPLVRRTRQQLGPFRDLLAAVFFLFFGLQIDPSVLPSVLVPAAVLGILSTFTKLVTGGWAARRAGVGYLGRLRAGAVLVARGEFSIVIAGLAVAAGLEPSLGPLAAAYILFSALLGPILAHVIEPIGGALLARKRA